MDQLRYVVSVEKYAERYYIKALKKKYKNRWDVTFQVIENFCKCIDKALQYKRADLISAVGIYKLVKLDFAVDGSKMPPKKFGGRCILLVNEQQRMVDILLVYTKNEIRVKNETVEWKKMVAKQYPEVKEIFKL